MKYMDKIFEMHAICVEYDAVAKAVDEMNM